MTDMHSIEMLLTPPQCFNHGPCFMWPYMVVGEALLPQKPALLLKHTATARERSCVQWPCSPKGGSAASRHRRVEMLTSHKQMHSCNALVTAVDISTLVGASVLVSSLGDAECAAGVVADRSLLAFPFDLGLS